MLWIGGNIVSDKPEYAYVPPYKMDRELEKGQVVSERNSCFTQCLTIGSRGRHEKPSCRTSSARSRQSIASSHLLQKLAAIVGKRRTFKYSAHSVNLVTLVRLATVKAYFREDFSRNMLIHIGSLYLNIFREIEEKLLL